MTVKRKRGCKTSTSSSSTRKTKTEPSSTKSLYVCLAGDPFQWCRIDIIEPNVQIGTLIPLERVSDSHGYYPGFSCIQSPSHGSVLYAFGGGGSHTTIDVEGNKDILVFDPKDPDVARHVFCWKRIGEMPMARFAPVLIAFQDRIHVFGSYSRRDYPAKSWAMTFHTGKDKDELHGAASPPPPPELVRATKLGHAAACGDCIYIEADQKLFAFDPISCLWEDCTTIHPAFPHISQQNVVADGFLLTFWFGTLAAYDFKEKICICPVPGFDQVLDPRARAEAGVGFVLELGSGNLCLVWITPKNGRSSTSYLNVVAFKVVRDDSKRLPYINASIFSTAKYPVNATSIWCSVANACSS